MNKFVADQDKILMIKYAQDRKDITLTDNELTLYLLYMKSRNILGYPESCDFIADNFLPKAYANLVTFKFGRVYTREEFWRVYANIECFKDSSYAYTSLLALAYKAGSVDYTVVEFIDLFNREVILKIPKEEFKEEMLVKID